MKDLRVVEYIILLESVVEKARIALSTENTAKDAAEDFANALQSLDSFGSPKETSTPIQEPEIPLSPKSAETGPAWYALYGPFGDATNECAIESHPYGYHRHGSARVVKRNPIYEKAQLIKLGYKPQDTTILCPSVANGMWCDWVSGHDGGCSMGRSWAQTPKSPGEYGQASKTGPSWNAQLQEKLRDTTMELHDREYWADANRTHTRAFETCPDERCADWRARYGQPPESTGGKL